MSSPLDSNFDFEDAASKKRGRAQSVEPTPAPKNEIDSEKHHAVSAPKKSKRDEEGQPTNSNNNSRSNSVSTIRKNMKDMSTTDKTTDHLDNTITGHSQDSNYDGEDDTDHTMGTINEKYPDIQTFDHDSDNKDSGNVSPSCGIEPETDHNDKTTTTTTATTSSVNGLNGNNTTHVFSRFGNGTNGDTDDWGEFADNDDEKSIDHNLVKDSTTFDTGNDKPKYAFGSSSGFGTKGWGSTLQATSNTQKTAPFTGISRSGFGLSSTASSTSVPAATSGFGAFTSAQSSTTKSTTSAFGAFSNGLTSSPFALAAATSNTTNALSSLPKVPSSALSPGESASSVETHDNETGNGLENNDVEHIFGEGSKIKIPGVKPMEVKTGEEDENTVYQTKAKLLILDNTTNNWKERGSGTLRINIKETTTAGKSSNQARLVMRTDSVYRLILNLLLFSEMKTFIMQDRFVRFAAFESETKEDGSTGTKLVNYALKVANPFTAQELHHQITSRIPSKTN